MPKAYWLIQFAVLLVANACALPARIPSDNPLRPSSADSLAAANAIVSYAVQVRLGRWAEQVPEVVCVETVFSTVAAIRAALDTVPRDIVPATECALHSSADPPLAPLVRHLSTLRRAIILRLTSMEQASDDRLHVLVRWDAGYHHGGDSRCELTRQRDVWTVVACRSAPPT
jgi:hypothetical protein